LNTVYRAGLDQPLLGPGTGLNADFTDKVSQCLLAMKGGKAAGHDGLPAELLKGGPLAVSRLTQLFNVIWVAGPSSWRKA
jgi:hypothetical protein